MVAGAWSGGVMGRTVRSSGRRMRAVGVWAVGRRGGGDEEGHFRLVVGFRFARKSSSRGEGLVKRMGAAWFLRSSIEVASPPAPYSVALQTTWQTCRTDFPGRCLPIEEELLQPS